MGIVKVSAGFGAVLAAAFKSNAATDGGAVDEVPQVTTDGAGNWVAVWPSSDSLGGTIGTDRDILVARSTDNGATWTAPAALNTNAATDAVNVSDFDPQVTTDGAGNWVAVWELGSTCFSGDLGDCDILVARSTDNGASWTAPAALNTNAATDAGNDRNPQVTTDGSGNWVAVWHSNENLGSTIGTDFDILVARSTNNGATWTAPAALDTNAATDAGDDLNPQVTTDGAGNWVAAWDSNDSLGGTIGTDFDILYTNCSPLESADGDSDGVVDACDNCPATANGPAEAAVLGVGNQTDSDGDGVPGVQPPTNGTFGGDACDVDDDNDGIADANDGCRVLAEDYDGFQDADGCPEPDNDMDGICDPGQTSVSCTGSDEGKSAFYPPGHDHGDPASIDCRNVPEDYDGFKDGDGCPEPDNDNDGFPDATDACPGTAIHAGADGALGSPEDFNHNGIQDGGESPLTTDDIVMTFEDYDGILDTDGCHDSPGDDFDGDSLGLGDPFGLFFRDEVEVFMGTLPGFACAATPDIDDEDPDATGTDWDDSQDVDGSDVFLFAQRFGTEPGEPPPLPPKLPYSQRFDIYPTAASLNKIDGSDVFVLATYFGTSCP